MRYVSGEDVIELVGSQDARIHHRCFHHELLSFHDQVNNIAVGHVRSWVGNTSSVIQLGEFVHPKASNAVLRLKSSSLMMVTVQELEGSVSNLTFSSLPLKGTGIDVTVDAEVGSFLYTRMLIFVEFSSCLVSRSHHIAGKEGRVTSNRLL